MKIQVLTAMQNISPATNKCHSCFSLFLIFWGFVFRCFLKKLFKIHSYLQTPSEKFGLHAVQMPVGSLRQGVKT